MRGILQGSRREGGREEGGKERRDAPDTRGELIVDEGG